MSDMLKIDDAGGVVEVSFIQQDILDEANIQQIGTELDAAIEGKAAPKLIIDFGNVRHLSSAALGVLITVNNRSKESGGQMCLANIAPEIFQIFKITKLDRIFSIHDTCMSARESLS